MNQEDTSHIKVIRRNDRGYRIGECHHRAKCSDALVRKLRDLHEYHGMSDKELAEQFGIALRTVMKIVYYERRLQ